MTVLNRVLNATVQRTADHAAPEITLDPLEIVGGRYFRGSPPPFFSAPPEPGGIIRTSQPPTAIFGLPSLSARLPQERFVLQKIPTSARLPGNWLASRRRSSV